MNARISEPQPSGWIDDSWFYDYGLGVLVRQP
jgi:hypothetical protein